MMTESTIRSVSRSKTAHRPRTGSGKFRSRLKPAGSWQADPLIQHAQNPRGRAPDIALLERHGVVRTLDAAEFLAVHLMVHRVHQERQRNLESIVDFGFVDAQLEARLHPRNRRQDAISEPGCVQIEVADRIDEFPGKADLLLGLTYRRLERRGVGRVDLAAGEGDLAGVIVKMRRAL